ncbi:MAG: WG repeat-containing protein [Planctomycetota bacterium]
MANPAKKPNSIVLTLGVSLVVTALAAYLVLNRADAIAPIEKSELFPFQDPDTRLWGYLDQDAKVAIPAKFEFADLFLNGLGMVEDEGLAGYIDAKGQWVVAPRYVLDPDFPSDIAARPFWGGFAAVRTRSGDKPVWGFIDTTGEWAILPRFTGEDGFQLVGDFRDGRAWFAKGERFGYIDSAGDVVIEPTFHAANDFGEGMAGVLIKDEWGVIDTKGKLRIRPDFDGIGTFSQGLCAVKDDDQWGYIDRDGDWVISAKYAGARPFSEGLAPAHNGVAWGYINPDGQYVIDPIYDEAWPHEHGLASVEINGQRKYIDANGKVAWPKPARNSY